MRHTETYVVDLNGVYEGRYLTISRTDTLEYGRGVLVDRYDEVGIQEGDHVPVYSDDEEMSWEARVVKQLPSGTRYAVEVLWETGRSVEAQPKVITTGARTEMVIGRSPSEAPAFAVSS